MKCAEFLQELTNYLDGVLDDRTKAELEDHLAWCHNWRSPQENRPARGLTDLQ